MKEEALKLADELEKPVQVPNQPEMIYIDGHRMYASQMIRRLVEELDKHKEIDGVFDYYCDENIRSKQTKPLSDAEIHEVWKSVTKNKFRGCHIDLVRAIEVKHGIRDIFRWHWEE